LDLAGLIVFFFFISAEWQSQKHHSSPFSVG